MWRYIIHQNMVRAKSTKATFSCHCLYFPSFHIISGYKLALPVRHFRLGPCLIPGDARRDVTIVVAPPGGTSFHHGGLATRVLFAAFFSRVIIALRSLIGGVAHTLVPHCDENMNYCSPGHLVVKICEEHLLYLRY